MKIAIFSEHPNSAIDHVLRPVVAYLREEGWTVDKYGPRDTPSLDGYDVAHFGWLGVAPKVANAASCPTTVGMWSVPVAKVAQYGRALQFNDYNHHIVDDTMTLQILGQLGITNVTMIPLEFDTSAFKPLLLPTDSDFRVGVFGNAYDSKRFHVVRDACKEAGVDYFPQIFEPGRALYMLDPLQDVYPHAHVFVHASFIDTNSMPLQEALLCGRPVVTTHNDGIHRYVQHKVNGCYYDGSVSDLASKLKWMREHYAFLLEGVKRTRIHSAHKGPRAYKKVFERVVEEQW